MTHPHKIHCEPVEQFKANGPMDYARAARKFNIQPTPHSCFFVRDGKLKRFLPSEKPVSGHSPVQEGAQGRSENQPENAGGENAKESTTEQHPPPSTHAPSSQVEHAQRHPSVLEKVEQVFGRIIGHAHVKKDVSGHDFDFDGINENQGETEVTAVDVQNDLEYVVPVEVGDQKVRLDFDMYDPEKSGAKQQPDELFNISYADGSFASGVVFTDRLKIGDLVIPDQSIEVPTDVSPAFASLGSDGLLGLAFPKLNTAQPNKVATPLQNMMKGRLLEQPIFTVKLSHGSAAESFNTFGYVDDGVPLASDYTYVDVDSGTTLLLLDDATVEAVYKQIPGSRMSRTAGGYVFPVTSATPDIGLEVNGRYFGIPGIDLMYSDAGDGMAFGAIQSRGKNPTDIWGDVFLKRVYAIFNAGSQTLGLARRPIITATFEMHSVEYTASYEA